MPTDGWTLLLGVLTLLGLAWVLGAVAERLRQNAIVGYLLAGMVLGPHALHWVQSEEQMEILGELGVSLLLFTIGLEFSWPRLRRLGKVALLGGTMQVIATLGVGALIALAFGLAMKTAIVVGAMIALSSTACVLRMLSERAEMDSQHGRGALGVLLLQDIAVVPLVLMTGLFAEGGTAGEMAKAAATTLGLAIVLIGALWVMFNYVVPWVLGTRIMRKNRELPLLLGVITALGATVAAHEFKISPALGAFTAGLLLGSSPFAVQVQSDVSGLKTLLVTLFFAAVGMYADPEWMAAHWWQILVVLGVIVIGKTAIIWGVLSVLRVRSRSALATGLTLAQIGEFSFVLAKAAQGSVLSDDLFKLMVSATIVSLVLTPYLVMLASRLSVARDPGAGERSAGRAGSDAGDGGDDRPLVVVVGFGPAGQTVTRSLVKRNARVIVVDLNPRIAQLAAAEGAEGHHGDASHAEILEHAGMERASAIVVTAPDPRLTIMIVQQARAIGPQAKIVARARYSIWHDRIRDAGAETVIDEEKGMGRRLAASTRHVLKRVERMRRGDGAAPGGHADPRP